MSDGLSLEKLKIAERLTALEEQAKGHNALLKLHNDNLIIILQTHAEDIKNLKHTVHGNGSIGLNERVRAVEALIKQVRVIWVACLVFTANLVKDVFIK